MSMKRKGTNAERELLRAFWERGWATIRSAGSGSMQYPSPDLLVGKNGRRLAIECKLCSSSKKYLTVQEVKELQYFSNTFGAECWIAVKFSGKPWYFFLPEDLHQTEKSYVVDSKTVDLNGLELHQVLEEE